MTFPAELRPGAPTVPQALTFASAAQAAHLQFLTAEERATAVLMGFYQDARLELEDFIRNGSLTVSDQTFYRQLLDETNRIASRVNGQGTEWVSSTIPDAYSAGWRQNSSVVVPQEALKALSQETLGLIRETTDDIRASIRSAISKGILEGLPPDALRQRILASGLTNIPHWPNVEYRAGVIARTETMRAYNAGNIAAIESNGARFAEWIASPDEATCSICLPRDGKVFRLSAGEDAPGSDPYPNALPLPKIPAHPRCRCTVRAVYRNPDGSIIGSAAETPPKLPSDAMGGDAPATLPPAVGDFENALKRLAEAQSIMDIDDVVAMKKFWQDIDLRSIEGALDRIAALEARSFRNFADYRYGISVQGLGLKSVGAQERRWLIETLESFESIGFKWRDSPWLREWVFDTSLPRGLPNPAAYYPADNRVIYVRNRLPDTPTYRIGSDPYAKTTMLHELGHALDHHLFGNDHLLFAAIHSSTGQGPAGALIKSQLENAKTLRQMSLDRIKKLEADIDFAETPDQIKTIDKDLELHRLLVGRFDEQIRQLEKLAKNVGDADSGTFPTDYATSNEFEDFADTLVMYMLDPEKLKAISPARFEFFAARLPRGT